jgi:hypothetical protein
MTEHGRNWTDEHVAAGYHEQDWGPPPSDKAEVIGTYEGTKGRVAVRLVERGPTGVAELELEWENGQVLTVLNESVARQYLILEGAVRVL